MYWPENVKSPFGRLMNDTLISSRRISPPNLNECAPRIHDRSSEKAATLLTRVANGCCASPVVKKPVTVMKGRPAAVGLLGVMAKPRSRRLRPLVTVGFASIRLIDARATLIMLERMIQVSDAIASCSVATAVLPAGEKFEPPSGFTLFVCPAM